MPYSGEMGLSYAPVFVVLSIIVSIIGSHTSLQLARAAMRIPWRKLQVVPREESYRLFPGKMGRDSASQMARSFMNESLGVCGISLHTICPIGLPSPARKCHACQ